MTEINTGFTQAPLGARLPRILTGQSPVGGSTPAYGTDQLALNGPTGGADATDPASIQAALQSPNPADRFRAVVTLTNMPPAQAIPLLQLAAQNDNAQVRDLAAQALNVMQRMPGANTPQQPATNQPGMQPQPQPQPQQPAYNGYQPQPQQPVMQYQPPSQLGQINPADAEFLVQTLSGELTNTMGKGIAAVQQLAAIAQQAPAQKENVFNILLNHIYNRNDEATLEAVKALGGMNDPRALPYIEAMYRKPGYDPALYPVAMQIIQQMRANPSGQVGVASVDPTQNVEYLRVLEIEMQKPGQEGLVAFNQIRNSLGPDPRAQSATRQEVIRILLTHIATSAKFDTVAAACTLLGQMGAREMDTLRYLDALKRKPGSPPEVSQAADAAIRQIVTSPAR